jgi:transcriptional regulator with XRE-family HTH domain
MAPLMRKRRRKTIKQQVEESDLLQRFGARLRSLRLERQISQEEMAQQFGIDRSFLSDMERGKKASTLGMLQVLARGLGLTLSDLMRGVDDQLLGGTGGMDHDALV